MRLPIRFNIAGLSHHCTNTDNGKYEGYTKAEPENAYDRNAIAIYSDNGKKVGYVPADLTGYFRIWGRGKTDFKCKINIEIGNDGYRDYWNGSISLQEEFDYSLKDKVFYLGKTKESHYLPTDPYFIYLHAFKVRTSKKTAEIEYVVTEDSETLPKYIKEAKKEFKFITYEEYFKLLIDEIEPNEFKGKNVAIVYKSDSLKYNLVYDYLVECGANVTTKYTKSKTDIVIDRTEYGKLKATERAEADGKIVMIDNDVIRKMGYDIQDKTVKTTAEVINKTEPIRVVQVDTSEPIRVDQVEKPQRATLSTPKQSSGCMVVILALIIIGAVLITL